MQPLILLAFIALMFFTFESVIYGDNQVFEDYSGTVCHPSGMCGKVPCKSMPNTMCGVNPHDITKTCDLVNNDNTKCVCQDAETIACVYYTLIFRDFDISGFTDFFGSQQADLTAKSVEVLIRDLFILVLLCFLFYAALENVETMGQAMTDTISKLGSMAAAGVKNPYEIGQKVFGTATSAAKLPGKMVGAAASGVEKLKKARAAIGGGGAGAASPPPPKPKVEG